MHDCSLMLCRNAPVTRKFLWNDRVPAFLKQREDTPDAVTCLQHPPQMSRLCAKKSELLTRIELRYRWVGTLPRHSVFVRSAAATWVGIPMKSAIAAHLPDEHFVIRVDGRVKSHHRRFLDALREGLQLRDQFPWHDVKVQSMQADDQQRTALH